MSSMSLHADHPTDALPAYVRGRSEDAEAIERHLERCEACRIEVEILRALEDAGPAPMTDMERRRVYRGFEDRRVAGSPRSGWVGTTWRAAAAVAVLLTGVGVWQAVGGGAGSTGWSPELALEGWGRDLIELDVEPEVVQAAFGLAFADEIPWEDLEGVDPFELEAPWEEN